MGLSALKCDGYADSANVGMGEGRLAASDFSGTDLLKSVALTAAMVLAAGCIGKPNTDGTAQHQPQEQPPANSHGAYPFDISATPEGGGREGSAARFKFNNTETVGNVKGFHSDTTNANYWIEFKGKDSDAHYNYEIYRVDPSGAVEQKHVALENFNGAFSKESYNKKYFNELENPDLQDQLAIVDFKGNSQWQDLKLIVYASATLKPGYLVPAGSERITELIIGEANVSTRFVKEQK